MALISIGKFAKEIGVTVNTLRHMQETGELVPAHISKGGTRYYSTEQLDKYKLLRKKIEDKYRPVLDKAVLNDKIDENFALLEHKIGCNITKVDRYPCGSVEGYNIISEFLSCISHSTWKSGRCEDLVLFEKIDHTADFEKIVDEMRNIHTMAFVDHYRYFFDGHDCVGLSISPYISFMSENSAEREHIIMGYFNKLIEYACPDIFKYFNIYYLNEDETIYVPGSSCTIVFLRKFLKNNVDILPDTKLIADESYCENLNIFLKNEFTDDRCLCSYLQIMNRIFEKTESIADKLSYIIDVLDNFEDIITQKKIDDVSYYYCSDFMREWYSLKIYSDLLADMIGENVLDIRSSCDPRDIINTFAAVEEELRNLRKYLIHKKRKVEATHWIFCRAEERTWRKIKIFIDNRDEYYEKLKRLGQVVKLPSNFAEFMFVDNIG